MLVLPSGSGSEAPAQATWKRAYGGVERDVAHSVKALDDGGAIVCGSTGSFGTLGGDLYLIRLDASGERVWSLIAGGAGVQEGADVVLLPDGGFLAVGSSNSGAHGGYDGYVACVTDDGRLLWERTYGTSDWDFLSSAAVDGDHVLLAGRSYGLNDPAGDLLLVKIDLLGEVRWMNSYGPEGKDDGGYVKVRGDGNYILSGFTGEGAEADGLVVLVGQDGDEVWTVRVMNPDAHWVGGVALTDADDALLAGYVEDGDGRRRMYLAKVSADGEVLFSRPVSSGGNDWEARAVASLADGGIAVTGYTKEYGAGDRDISLLFLDAGGEFIRGPTYGGAQRDEAWSLDITDDGAYYIAGNTTSYGPGAESVFVIRSDGDTLNGGVVSYDDPVGIARLHVNDGIRVYPVPMTSGGTAMLRGGVRPATQAVLLDVSGREVVRLDVSFGQLQLPLLAEGMFTLVVYGGDELLHVRPVIIE